MSQSYYYFASSLIHIQFGIKEPQSVNDFLTDAMRLLSKNDFACLSNLVDGNLFETSNGTAKAWIKFENDLKNELAWQRSEKKGEAPTKYIRGSRDIQPSARDLVGQALKAANPLESEKFIDNVRWQYLDDLTVGQFFNFDYILAYGLKLKILERYHQIESPRGKEIFEKIKNVDDILVGLI